MLSINKGVKRIKFIFRPILIPVVNPYFPECVCTSVAREWAWYFAISIQNVGFGVIVVRVKKLNCYNGLRFELADYPTKR